MKYSVDAFPGRTFFSNGKEYLYFGGTGYLGLQTDLAFQDLYLQNIRKYGTGYSASRASNVRFSVYEEAESHMAKLFGCQACFTVSSGFLASQLVADYFVKQKYALFYAPETHVALQTAGFQNESNYAALQKKIHQFLNKNPEAIIVVLLDTVQFFGQNYPYFEWLKKLPLERIILVADDSHGFGILGTSGKGSYGILETLQSKELIVCGSLGKGYGIQAGAIIGNSHRIKSLKNTAMFAASSPAVPAAMATYLEATSIYQLKLQKLRQNCELFRKLLQQPHRFFSMPDHPAFTFKDDGLTAYLEDQFIIITNFPYPNDSGDKINRIVLSAHHTADDIKKLCELINSFNYTNN
ncbi:aminotransferase class I/II-fold pyridoxal phosphate-dependent enzyme [Ascidiimonas sp. W6]|uniref:aminotransferase class I/II-fold pyridoxal phosphate-dependent enzyme n=1 Tax=Ascidiimonas meishanensis TaxID=3128903 RepID=UPI0030EB3DE0